MLPTTILLGLSLLTAGSAPAEDLPAASEILAKIDENMVFDTRSSRITMTVQGKRRTRSYEMVTFGRGEADSAIEYLSPARDKGTRILKLDQQLWIYMPTVDRTQKISGHMLRQGMMGSDISYEDMMASTELEEMYEASITGEDSFDGRPCWKLQLVAHDDSVTYPKRVSWIDKELYIPLKQELYALSGMLLKTWTMTEIKRFDGDRQFPTRMQISDHLKKDSSTVIEFTELKFGIELEEEVFSNRWLERK
jgi:outer membrane lipoprotein-sorting protein